MSNIVKIQVPMDKGVRDALDKRAKQFGFDSIQAYIRFWAKAEVDNRRVDLSVDDWGQPSPEAAMRLNQSAEDVRNGNNVSKPFTTVEAFMEDLQA